MTLETYTAIQVAKFIVTYAMNRGNPVTPLKLQKLLFFLWAEVFHRNGTELFTDTIYAWQFGPVVLSVYNRFCANGGMAIRNTYDDIGINDHDASVLSEILNRYMGFSARDLVDLTHRRGMAWDRVYRNGEGNHQSIGFNLIIEHDCQNLPT